MLSEAVSRGIRSGIFRVHFSPKILGLPELILGRFQILSNSEFISTVDPIFQDLKTK